jgi:hypothetical protein
VVVPKMPPDDKSAIGKTQEAGAAPAPGPAPVGSEQITLTAKNQIAALVEAKPKAAAKAPAEKPAKQRTAKVMGQPGKPGKAAAPAYQIQLGAMRADSPAIAAMAAANLERSHAQILAGLKVSALRADLGARGTFYRLRAGPFADIFAARDMCDKFKAHNQPCLVLLR